MSRAGQTPHGARPNREGVPASAGCVPARRVNRAPARASAFDGCSENLRVGRLSYAVMCSPEEWPSRRKADRIRLTGPAASLFLFKLRAWAFPGDTKSSRSHCAAAPIRPATRDKSSPCCRPSPSAATRFVNPYLRSLW